MRRNALLVMAVFICFSLVLLLRLHSRKPESNSEHIADSFRLPRDGTWIVSQEYAQWNSKWCGYHLAEDVGRATEVPVYATANGVVRFAALAQLGYGYVVIIEHKLPPEDPAGEYVYTVYGHLRRENLISIDQVLKDELIGHLSENPEYNCGFIHLHFGIRTGQFVMTGHDPRRGRWYYGGYTTIFGECNKDNMVHRQIMDEWINPTNDLTNGEGFINAHIAEPLP